MSEAIKYGSRYWAIEGEGGVLFLWADSLEVLPSGALIAWGGFRDANGQLRDIEKTPVYGLAKGEWQSFFAASAIDDSMVAFDH